MKSAAVLKSVPGVKISRTVQELTAAQAECEKKVAYQMRERNAKRAELQEALTSSEANQFATARTLRDELTEIDGGISLLEEQRRALDSALADARAHESRRKREVARQAAIAYAARMRAAAAEIQHKIDDLAKLTGAFHDLEAAFGESLPALPNGFSAMGFSASLTRLIPIRLYAVSGGKNSVRGVFESPTELLESKRADLLTHLENQLAVGLRAFEDAADSPNAA
jgi:hypothetical protein